jgi:hypothetical protein
LLGIRVDDLCEGFLYGLNGNCHERIQWSREENP